MPDLKSKPLFTFPWANGRNLAGVPVFFSPHALPQPRLIDLGSGQPYIICRDKESLIRCIEFHDDDVTYSEYFPADDGVCADA
jgi:hypothetical protein